jgi:hypothetical protein
MSEFEPIFGPLGLALTCGILLVALAVVFLILWIFIACLIDVFKKTDTEFPDRTLWIILLLGSLFLGFMGITTLIYYFMYRPRLDFWNR